MPHVTSPLRLQTDRSALLVVDVQQKLLPLIPSGDNVVRQTTRLIEAAELLRVPVAATVQYPKGLGPLVEPLRKMIAAPEEKMSFSAAVCRKVLDEWAASGRDQIVVVGIETHVCIQQTVLDLLAEGQLPYVVAEAVAARHGRDHETAMQRMHDAGATITTVESVLFEWLSTADRPEFKAVSKMIKG